MKMLLLRVTVILISCWIVVCDLLDLYVQHMDETMRTKWYKKHPIDSVSRRIKRSFGYEMPQFKLPEAELLNAELHKPIDSIKMQQDKRCWLLDEIRDERFPKDVERINSNKQKENSDSKDEHDRSTSIREIMSMLKSKSIDADDEIEPTISQNPKEHKKDEIHMSHRYSESEENRDNNDKPLEINERKPVIVDNLGLLYKRSKKSFESRKKQSFGSNSIDQQSFDNSWLKKNEIRKNDVWKYLYAPLKNLDPEEKFENPSRVEETKSPFIDSKERTRVPQTLTAKKEEDEIYMPHYFPESEEKRTDKFMEIEDSEDVNEMENDEDSLFEIIKENERQFSFDEPSLKKTPKPSETQVPKKYLPMSDKPFKPTENAKSIETKNDRPKRSAPNYRLSRYEKLDDDGDVVLEWDPLDEKEVTFRVTGKTLGYVGIGFNDKNSMKGADILLTWVDDHTGVANALDMHGVKEMNAAPHADSLQDVRVRGGSQNATHTTVEFVRKWQTCDPQDYPLSEDTVTVIWAMHHTDPELNTAAWHERKRGGKILRLKTAATYSPPETLNALHWDVKLNPFNITGDEHTIYWCKIFQIAPAFSHEKHHMIGYAPLVEKANEDLVHHMILYECSTDSILERHTRLAGAKCYSQTIPKEWNLCTRPVLTWIRGSKGEWLPEHIGISIGEHKNKSFYMLEVHYNNPGLRKVIDQSGVRLYLSPRLRSNEAGIFFTGMAVTPLHLVPPQQKEYATAGYCASHCTNASLPEKGINVVSVVLHSHLAGRRLNLKHIRQGKELPRIVQDNHFDFNYQLSHVLQKEVNVLPGDELVTECVYGTLNRTKPTLGGWAASEEMCLAFVMYYPTTHLVSCYSLTPVEDLFKTLGVVSFKGMTMESVKKLFLKDDYISSSINQLSTSPKSIDEEDNADVFKEAQSVLETMRDYTNNNEPNVFTQLIIQNPEEFRGRTMADHMITMPWTDELLAKAIENILYHGKHMTFCKRKDYEYYMSPTVLNFPNYTALPKANDTICSELKITSATSGVPRSLVINLVNIFIVLIFMI
ncbi:MOXD1 homolog 1 [Linepithema humile]|uniref:MOXD1 homolog 1 n=1 Tax=Linepithema humile TaxID=83485 RepID=UPI000623630A|nr:PREDICTED: MOXD1 homolog 1 [Linepithema humile]